MLAIQGEVRRIGVNAKQIARREHRPFAVQIW